MIKYLMIAATALPILWGASSTTAPVSLNAPVVYPVAASANSAFPDAYGPAYSALASARDSTLNGSWGDVCVWKQTTHTDGAQGSFRAIVEDSVSDNCYDIVIPLGGTTVTTTRIDIGASNVYIAGQAATDSGFVLRHPGDSSIHGGLLHIGDNTNDIVIRYVTLECGDDTSAGGSGSCVVLSGSGAKGDRFYIDHVSAHFGTDQAMSFYGDTFPSGGVGSAGTITIANSILGPGIENHNLGMNTGGPEGNTISASNFNNDTVYAHMIGIYLSVFHSNKNRNPLIRCNVDRNGQPGGSSAGIQLVNNIFINWGGRVANTESCGSQRGYGPMVDDVANYYIEGNATSANGGDRRQLIVDLSVPGSGSWPKNSYYAKRHYAAVNALDWLGFDTLAFTPESLYQWGRDAGGKLSSSEADSVFATSSQINTAWALSSPYTRTTASAAYTTILEQVGMSRILDSEGYWSAYGSMRSRVDTLLMYEIENPAATSGSSAPADDEWGGLLTIGTTTSFTDSDGDGMPDDFENTCGGSTTGLSRTGDISGDGYMNIEEFLNGTNSVRHLAWDDNSVGEDGFKVWRDTGSGFNDLVATLGPNVTTWTDEDSRIGYRYMVMAYKGASNSPQSNIITSTCN